MDENSKKRARVDSELGSNSSGSNRIEPVTELAPNQPESKKSRQDSVDGSSEAGHIPVDLLDILDDSDTVNDRDSSVQDLDSVIKSFEEEILPQPSFSTTVDLTSDSGESQPDIGYLFEASDDELGLPPTQAGVATDEPPVDLTMSNSSGEIDLGSMIELEKEFPGYDSFEFGLTESTPVNDKDNSGNGSGDFVTVDGLFDYAEPLDFSGLPWRAESLPAL